MIGYYEREILIKYLILFVLLFSTSAHAKKHERDYQNKHCKGIIEYALHDRTRVDCLTDTHAIEYDFSNKWHQAIGQSLGYAFETGKRAGIVLIVKKPKHMKHWYKLNSIIMHNELKIDTWIVKAWEK